MKISDMKFSLTVYSDKIALKWEKFSDVARYVLVRKRISNPVSMFDGNRIYIGNDISFEDYTVINGEIYYYRLFVLPDSDDDFMYLTDNKLSIRIIALQISEKDDYSEYLYNSLPKNVKYSDASLKGQNKPLKRFIRLFCYPFNKLNAYTDSMLNQIDVDTCDEIYLPYHAKWLGRFYDERFGSDINRLLLKTLEEAEPFIGTKMGLEYILQRVFKAEVEIEEKIVDGCCIESIKLHFDVDNAWLTRDVASSILRIIIEYLPIRVRFEIISSLIAYDEYDTQRMDDIFLHDSITELNLESVDHYYKDLLSDYLNTGILDANEVYHVLIDRYDIEIGVTNGKSNLNDDFTTNVAFYGQSIVSYKDRIIETNKEDFSYEVYDTISEYDINEIEYESYAYDEILEELFTIASETDLSIMNEVYKFGNVLSYPDSHTKKFGTTNNGIIGNNLVTNAVEYGVFGSTENGNITNRDARLSVDIKTGALVNEDNEDSPQSRISYLDKVIDTTKLSYSKQIEDWYGIEDIVITFGEKYIIENEDLLKDNYIIPDYDVLKIFDKIGMTNSPYSLLNNASTNAQNIRLLDHDEYTEESIIETSYAGVKEAVEITKVMNRTINMLSILNGIGTLSNDIKVDCGERYDDEVLGKYSDEDNNKQRKSNMRKLRQRSVKNNEEIVNSNYLDNDEWACVRTRPESLIGSECVISRNFYTTDISYNN